ncbi:hypothetical protein CC85DRAFT_285607 [Cutaneotrichosporon oleaginosum]|uniref:F-box domain-containing protein n=1 Tax=Cutaneotrichosporon oleaginosum TaxID=879819 RepID=A0A0J1B405_9TREE|nr:uncharacterized protein CC85DRAFT_285607 [Cutaneotrichosporon oleaginosum]KLT42374.1 hypothetical protein CC85DRAFT_285607 [Cutaneotrichosporon oleaginosum]TXT04194.1 hypothetical protein COLE_07891 [Cutaneotrichosporon oleaginosum]
MARSKPTTRRGKRKSTTGHTDPPASTPGSSRVTAEHSRPADMSPQSAADSPLPTRPSKAARLSKAATISRTSPALSSATAAPLQSAISGGQETSAVLEYLKARGFNSTLAALTAELADVEKRERSAAPLSVTALLWGNQDIVAEIVSFLGMSDLRSCLSISKAFYSAATPLLYRRLRVQHLNCHCRPPPDRDMELVARYTTAVELFPHQHVQHYLKPLKIPRLQTLVINYNPDPRAEMTGLGSSLHMCRFCPDSHPTAPRLVVRPIAGLFKGRKPATTIIVPTATFPDTTCTIAPETVIHIARMTCQTKYTRSFWMTPRSPVANPTRSITFVLLPMMWDHGPVGHRRPPWGEAQSVGNLGSSLIDSLVQYALQFGDHRINIVGLEDANPFAKKEHWDVRAQRREIFEQALKTKLDCLLNNGFRFTKWSNSEREWRRESLRLTTFADYLRSGEWGEEMDWQLVGRWLNTCELREKGLLGTLKRKSQPRKSVPRKRKAASRDNGATIDTSDVDDEDYTDS